MQPGDRILVGHFGTPSAPRILITDPLFASRSLAVTGLPNRWIDGVAFEAARGQLFLLSRDVYAVQVSGDQAIATF